MKKSTVTVFIPNSYPIIYTLGEANVADIVHWDKSDELIILFKGGKQHIYKGIPFVIYKEAKEAEG